MTSANTLANFQPTVTTIIGLEVHVQLKTRTKLFCGCSTTFGAPPNSQVCPVCLGMPGSLPVINEAAISLAVRAGLALDCDIPPTTKWDRKQYFYPDLPKGYQISQYDQPICVDGYLDIVDPESEESTRRIGITRAHLEEDAGKSMHDEAFGRSESRIDLNRCGTPLLEIVTEPDMRSSAEAKAYLTELKLLLTHLGVSDCEMQEGSLRVDANVNLHFDIEGKKVATPIVEIKNLNSFRNVQRAIDYEAERQLVAWEESGQTIEDAPKTTRGWDDVTEITVPQREKEDAADYRYFPDPDLLPVRLSTEFIDAIRESLGERPAVTRRRMQSQFDLKAVDADVIVNQGPSMIEYFETVATTSGDGRRAAAWVMQDITKTLKERSTEIDAFPIPATVMGDLVKRVHEGKLDNARARDVFAFLLERPESVDIAIKELGIQSVGEDDLAELCRSLLASNPQVVLDVKAGKLQALGPLIGQAKGMNPNANPKAVRELLLKQIQDA